MREKGVGGSLIVFLEEFLTPMNYDNDFFNTKYFWRSYQFSQMATTCVFLHSKIVQIVKLYFHMNLDQTLDANPKPTSNMPYLCKQFLIHIDDVESLTYVHCIQHL
jgi:hypothetical protein